MYKRQGLTTGTTYYYTAKATTTAGTSWGPVQTFVPANTALNKYSIPDLALWIDATDLDGDGSTDSVTNGTAVSSWTDKSLGGETVTQSNADLKPTRQANSFGSKPAVRFDGTGDLLAVSTIRAESGAYSVYASVRRPSQMGDTSGHLVSESSWNLIPSSSDTAFPAIIVKKSGIAGSLTNIKLGKSAVSTINDFGGDLGELLIFTRQLSSSEEEKVEGYLAHRWGATSSLDSNHPYKSVAPIFDNKPLIRDTSTLGNGPMSLVSGMRLWLDASNLTTADATWADKSSNSNDATKTGAPSVITNAQNGLSLMHYTGNGQYHDFSSEIKDIRTVFWVVSQDTSANGSGFRYLLCGSGNANFHNDGNGQFWGSTYAHANVRNGYTRMNGTTLSGNTNYPNNLSIITLRTTDNVSADRFGQDRGYTGRQ